MIDSSTISRGTICVNAIDNATGRLGILTNEHVALASQSPAPLMSYRGHRDPDSGTFGKNIALGNGTKGQHFGTIDAAFVPFSNQQNWEITPYGNYSSTSYANVRLGNNDQIIQGRAVMKIGQTTGVTEGTITHASINTVLNYGTDDEPDKQTITNVFRYSNQSLGGDSGGPVYFNDGSNLFLIGMNFAGPEDDTSYTYGVGCRIQNVMETLDVTPITNDSFNTATVNGKIEINQLNFSPVGAFVIPSEVKGNLVANIGFNAFANQTQLTSVTLPSTITSIGANAFAGCTNLTSINIPSRVTSIGAGAFSGCSALTDITIPASVTYIGKGAFVGCNNLNIRVDTGNSNYSAQGNILYNKAKSKIIGSGDIAANITIPNTVTEVGASAFNGNNNFEMLSILGSPTIGSLAFADCNKLKRVYCESYTVPTLGAGAFNNDNFTLYVPHSVQSEYVTAFAGYVNTVSSVPITVSFSSDGTIVDTLETYYGANITALTNPFKTGYDFGGWYENADFSGNEYANGGLWDSRFDMTVYAKWVPQTYYICFTGYGSENLADKAVNYGALIGTMPSVSKTGYTFYGWKNQYDEYYTADTVWDKLSNQTVSPDLRANQYTVTYNGNGGTVNAQSQTVYYDSVIDSFATAYRDGYTFICWNSNADGNGQIFAAPYTYVIDGDTTLYAQYTVNEYNVSFDKQGGIGGSDGVNATYDSAMPSGADVTAPTKIGYTFQGYYRYANGIGTKYYNADMVSANKWNLSDDTTLFAFWKANQYTVTLDKQNGTSGTGSINATYNASMPSGANITAPTRVGYTFQGYFQNVNGGGIKYYNGDMTSCNVWNVAGSSVIFACWTPNKYTVTLQKESGTGGSDNVEAEYLAPMPKATAPTRV